MAIRPYKTMRRSLVDVPATIILTHLRYFHIVTICNEVMKLMARRAAVLSATY